MLFDIEAKHKNTIQKKKKKSEHNSEIKGHENKNIIMEF